MIIKKDYEYVILSIIPEQVKDQSQDSCVLCTSLRFVSNHHPWSNNQLCEYKV